MPENLDVRPVGTCEATALSLLFTRYVSGEISDPAWMQMMSILDEGETSLEERVALVAFLNDACTDLGPDLVKVPRLNEIEDFVGLMRSA